MFLKQEMPEMDDFEGRKKTLALKEKYFYVFPWKSSQSPAPPSAKNAIFLTCFLTLRIRN